MTVRLYRDEDSMRHALVVALRKRGVDILTTLEVGTTEQTDEQQLSFATAEELSNSVAAVKRALEQAERGEGKSLEDFDRDFRARHGIANRQ